MTATATAEIEQQPQTKGGGTFVIVLLSLLGSLTLLERIQESQALKWSFLAALGFMAIWLGTEFVLAKRSARPLTLSFHFKRNHIVPVLTQAIIYVYWGLYWDEVGRSIPLIAGQLFFGYLFDIALSWRRFGHYRFGFGPVPIIGSINLFIWFRDPVYGFQFLMIAAIFLSRAYLTRERDGRRVHIFNPSAFALALFAIVLISGHWVHLTWANDIVNNLANGPYAYPVMFAAGIVSQLFVGITLIPLAGAISILLLSLLFHQVTGTWLFVETAIPIALLLAITLLITDPATSPRTAAGKTLFGITYSVTAVGLYLLLREMGSPPTDDDPGLSAAFFDKLLFLPFLNLTVPWFDAIGRRFPDFGRVGQLAGLKLRLVHIVMWSVVFSFIYWHIETHPGHSSSFWRQACIEGRYRACEDLVNVVAAPCSSGDYRACHNLGLLLEEGLGLEPDLKEAHRIWKHACQNGVAESCVILGESIMANAPSTEARAEARNAFKAGCQFGDRAGCTNGAIVDLQGNPPPALRAQALQKLQRSCQAGHMPGCDILAGETVNTAQTPSELGRAIQLFRKACEGRYAPACVHLGDFYFDGMGVPRDLAQATTLYASACQVDEPTGCLSLGQMVQRGLARPRPPQSAFDLFQRACKLGLTEACQGPRNR